MSNKQNYDVIVEIVKDILRKEGLLVGNWHLGIVNEVISSTKLKVMVDGGTSAQTVSCNPDIIFSEGDHVWVVFINGNARDKFVLCKRAIIQEEVEE